MEEPSLDNSSPLRSPSPTLDDDPPSVATPEITSTFKKPALKSTARATKERFMRSDIESILTCLENPLNFTSIYGTSGKTGIGKPNKTAVKGYTALAEFVCKQSKGRWKTLAHRAVKERFNRHKTLFVKVKEASKATGFGITEEDRNNNIFTVARKLESMFICFERMDALFGHRPNVTPLGSIDVCLDLPSTSQDPENDLLLENRVEEEEEEGEEEEEDEEGSAIGNGPGDAVIVFHDNNNEEDFNIESDNEVLDGDDIGSLSHTSSNMQHKRQSSDTESSRSSRRSRATDMRKRPRRVETGPSSAAPKNAFLSAFQEVFGRTEASEEIEAKKLRLEEKRLEAESGMLEWQKENEKKKREQAEKTEMAKLEWEKQKWREELEEKRSERRDRITQLILEKGKTVEEIQALLKVALP